MSGNSPIFIVGCYRSGTTLMRRTLNSCSDIFIAKETGYLPYIIETELRGAKLKDYIDSFLIREKWNNLLENEFVGAHEDEIIDLASIYKSTCLLEYSEKTRLNYWGDNTPTNTFVLHELLSMYPNAKFIHMLRDPRDVIASIRRLKFRKNHVYNAALEWLNYYTNWQSFKSTLNSSGLTDRYVEVNYEQFVREPGAVLKEIEIMINTKISLTEYVSAVDSVASIDHHKGLKDPINDRAVGRFKLDLTKKQIGLIESVLRTQLHNMGCQLTTSYKVSPMLEDKASFGVQVALQEYISRVIARLRIVKSKL